MQVCKRDAVGDEPGVGPERRADVMLPAPDCGLVAEGFAATEAASDALIELPKETATE